MRFERRVTKRLDGELITYQHGRRIDQIVIGWRCVSTASKR
jgi:hypothetical protein